MLREFRESAMKGNVIDMAVGIVIGGAFGTVIKSLVDDIIMPLVCLLLGNLDYSDLPKVLHKIAGPYAGLAVAKAARAASAIISFLIVAFSGFSSSIMLICLGKSRRQWRLQQQEHSFCYTAIPIKASRLSLSIAGIKQ